MKLSVHLITLSDGCVRVLNLPQLESSLSGSAISEIKQKQFLKDISYTNFHDKYTGKKIMNGRRILNKMPNMKVLFRREHKWIKEGH
jgi:preprotein translocase subunit Sec63